MQYEISAEVEKVAKAVIKEHLHDLASKNIRYITQEKKDDKTGVAVAKMRKGKPILGDIKLVSGLNAFLASGEDRTDHNGPTPFPCLVVSRHAWDLLKPDQRKAFVHQQLNRLDYDLDTGKPALVDYDVKEFSVITKLYGAWNDDLSSVEDQKTADERIPLLLETPAAVRWLSVEPLLGQIYLNDPPPRLDRPSYFYGYQNFRASDKHDIDWVVVGGESGNEARPMHPAWARALRDQCVAAGVPFFFKQWGEFSPIEEITGDAQFEGADYNKTIAVHVDGSVGWRHDTDPAWSKLQPYAMQRVGKKAAGRLLDGREWNEYPVQ